MASRKHRSTGDVSVETESQVRPDGYMPKDKHNVPAYEKGVRFGRSQKPIPADTVFRAKINRFSKKSILAETWIAVNSQAGTMTFINTYDGKTGEGYDVETFTFPIDPRRLDEKKRGMEEVPVDECPVCVPAKVAEHAAH